MAAISSKPHVCETCQKRFTCSHTLRTHIRIHIDDLAETKQFTHMRIFSEEKLNECGICTARHDWGPKSDDSTKVDVETQTDNVSDARSRTEEEVMSVNTEESEEAMERIEVEYLEEAQNIEDVNLIAERVGAKKDKEENLVIEISETNLMMENVEVVETERNKENVTLTEGDKEKSQQLTEKESDTKIVQGKPQNESTTHKELLQIDKSKIAQSPRIEPSGASTSKESPHKQKLDKIGPEIKSPQATGQNGDKTGPVVKPQGEKVPQNVHVKEQTNKSDKRKFFKKRVAMQPRKIKIPADDSSPRNYVQKSKASAVESPKKKTENLKSEKKSSQKGLESVETEIKPVDTTSFKEKLIENFNQKLYKIGPGTEPQRVDIKQVAQTQKQTSVVKEAPVKTGPTVEPCMSEKPVFVELSQDIPFENEVVIDSTGTTVSVQDATQLDVQKCVNAGPETTPSSETPPLLSSPEMHLREHQYYKRSTLKKPPDTNTEDEERAQISKLIEYLSQTYKQELAKKELKTDSNKPSTSNPEKTINTPRLIKISPGTDPLVQGKLSTQQGKLILIKTGPKIEPPAEPRTYEIRTLDKTGSKVAEKRIPIILQKGKLTKGPKQNTVLLMEPATGKKTEIIIRKPGFNQNQKQASTGIAPSIEPRREGELQKASVATELQEHSKLKFLSDFCLIPVTELRKIKKKIAEEKLVQRTKQLRSGAKADLLNKERMQGLSLAEKLIQQKLMKTGPGIEPCTTGDMKQVSNLNYRMKVIKRKSKIAPLFEKKSQIAKDATQNDKTTDLTRDETIVQVTSNKDSVTKNYKQKLLKDSPRTEPRIEETTTKQSEKATPSTKPEARDEIKVTTPQQGSHAFQKDLNYKQKPFKKRPQIQIQEIIAVTPGGYVIQDNAVSRGPAVEPCSGNITSTSQMICLKSQAEAKTQVANPNVRENPIYQPHLQKRGPQVEPRSETKSATADKGPNQERQIVKTHGEALHEKTTNTVPAIKPEDAQKNYTANLEQLEQDIKKKLAEMGLEIESSKDEISQGVKETSSLDEGSVRSEKLLCPEKQIASKTESQSADRNRGSLKEMQPLNERVCPEKLSCSDKQAVPKIESLNADENRSFKEKLAPRNLPKLHKIMELSLKATVPETSQKSIKKGPEMEPNVVEKPQESFKTNPEDIASNKQTLSKPIKHKLDKTSPEMKPQLRQLSPAAKKHLIQKIKSSKIGPETEPLSSKQSSSQDNISKRTEVQTHDVKKDQVGTDKQKLEKTKQSAEQRENLSEMTYRKGAQEKTVKTLRMSRIEGHKPDKRGPEIDPRLEKLSRDSSPKKNLSQKVKAIESGAEIKACIDEKIQFTHLEQILNPHGKQKSKVKVEFLPQHVNQDQAAVDTHFSIENKQKSDKMGPGIKPDHEKPSQGTPEKCLNKKTEIETVEEHKPEKIGPETKPEVKKLTPKAPKIKPVKEEAETQDVEAEKMGSEAKARRQKSFTSPIRQKSFTSPIRQKSFTSPIRQKSTASPVRPSPASPVQHTAQKPRKGTEKIESTKNESESLNDHKPNKTCPETKSQYEKSLQSAAYEKSTPKKKAAGQIETEARLEGSKPEKTGPGTKPQHEKLSQSPDQKVKLNKNETPQIKGHDQAKFGYEQAKTGLEQAKTGHGQAKTGHCQAQTGPVIKPASEKLSQSPEKSLSQKSVKTGPEIEPRIEESMRVTSSEQVPNVKDKQKSIKTKPEVDPTSVNETQVTASKESKKLDKTGPEIEPRDKRRSRSTSPKKPISQQKVKDNIEVKEEIETTIQSPNSEELSLSFKTSPERKPPVPELNPDHNEDKKSGPVMDLSTVHDSSGIPSDQTYTRSFKQEHTPQRRERTPGLNLKKKLNAIRRREFRLEARVKNRASVLSNFNKKVPKTHKQMAVVTPEKDRAVKIGPKTKPCEHIEVINLELSPQDVKQDNTSPKSDQKSSKNGPTTEPWGVKDRNVTDEKMNSKRKLTEDALEDESVKKKIKIVSIEDLNQNGKPVLAEKTSAIEPQNEQVNVSPKGRSKHGPETKPQRECLEKVKENLSLNKFQDDGDSLSETEFNADENAENLSPEEKLEDEKTEEVLIICNICHEKFTHTANLSLHMRMHFNEKFQITCSICSKKYVHEDMCNFPGSKDAFYICSKCDKKFKISNNFSKRPKPKIEKPEKISPKEYCNICDKEFKNRGYLKTHMRIHSGEKPYECEICQKKFTYKQMLVPHMRTHTGAKPYECKTCGKKFAQNGQLDRHTLVHTGEKAYSCNVCNRKFAQAINAVIHMRTHTGEKPYRCKKCAKRFTQQSNYKKHMRIHIWP